MYMKLLVFSDSHSSLWFMRQCVASVKPDGIIHLGDHFQDGTAIAEENENIPIYQVYGNCDGFYGMMPEDSVKLCTIDGVRLLLTHGHRFQVKNGLDKLIDYGKAQGVQGILYGHTHVAHNCRDKDGLLILNPGAAGSGGGSAAVLEIIGGKISACRIIGQADLYAQNH